MIFHMPQKRINQLHLNIENIAIDQVSDFKLLGLTINEHLNWKSHTDKLSNKSSKTMGVLNKLKHFVSLLKVNDILKLQELKFHYKYENNLLPYYLQNVLFKSYIHSHETRSQGKIHQWRPMHEYARKCIRFNIPSTVNSAPTNIIENIYTHRMQGFSKYIKQNILQLYQENCTINNCYICSRT